MSYQTEKFNVARSCLMLPHPMGEIADIAEAFFNIDLALHRYRVPDDFSDDGRRMLAELQRLVSTSGLEDPEGRGLHSVRAEQLSEDDQHRLSVLINELCFFFDEYDQIERSQNGY